MGFRPEPVLDIARGLSAFTSCYMVGAQLLNIWKELFIDRCPHCKGAGRVICKHCGGTKTMRRRPGEFHDVHGELVDRRADDQYMCMHCGPMVVYDLVNEAADNEADAFHIMDNMKDAYAGKLRRHRMPILAGTVPCPLCANNPRLIRHTPNYAKVFRLEEPWHLKISDRVGAYRGKSSVRPQTMLEYPSRKPLMEDLDPEHIVQTWKAEYLLAGRDYLEELLPEPEWKKEEAKEERSPTDKAPWETEDGANRPEPPMDLPEEQGLKYVDDSDSEVSSGSEEDYPPPYPYPHDSDSDSSQSDYS